LKLYSILKSDMAKILSTQDVDYVNQTNTLSEMKEMQIATSNITKYNCA